MSKHNSLSSLMYKACPFCGRAAHLFLLQSIITCLNPDCKLYKIEFTYDQWEKRPIEDDLQVRIAGLEMQNAWLNTEIAGLVLTAGCIDIYKTKNEILQARIAKLEDVLKRANDIAELWVCEGSWGEDERELLDILAFNQWKEEE